MYRSLTPLASASGSRPLPASSAPDRPPYELSPLRSPCLAAGRQSAVQPPLGAPADRGSLACMCARWPSPRLPPVERPLLGRQHDSVLTAAQTHERRAEGGGIGRRHALVFSLLPL